jgi:hypothetical protein
MSVSGQGSRLSRGTAFFTRAVAVAPLVAIAGLSPPGAAPPSSVAPQTYAHADGSIAFSQASAISTSPLDLRALSLGDFGDVERLR